MTTSTAGREPAAALRAIPILHGLSDADLDRLAGQARHRTVAAGDVLFDQGDPGDALFLILHGQLRVLSDASDDAVQLARVGPGEVLGEMALLADEPRSAAAVAEVDSELLELSRASFDVLCAEQPGVRERVAQVVDARHRDPARPFANEAKTLVALPPSGQPIRLGRAPGNDVVIAEPTIDGRHAELRHENGRWVLRDLQSRSGTYLNRLPVRAAPVQDGDEIWLGAVKLFLADGVLKQFEPSRGIRVEARGVGNVVGGGRRILGGVDLAVYPGELVALVGPSGAGKTTLLHDLLGFTPPTDGHVYYDSYALDTHLDLFRRVLGYVPQSDIIHPELSVQQTLRYAGRIRLPADTTDDELNARIDRVLDQVGLAEERHNTVGRLSGGQRKRASIAVELLTEPRVLFLDEPTSGLDPGLDEQMMLLFRNLADEGRTVVLTTHATRNLRLCDRVLVLSHGRDVFMGSPDEALQFFGVEDFIQVYPTLAAADPAALSGRYHQDALYERGVAARLIADGAAPPARREGAEAAGSVTAHARRTARQFYYLAARYFAIIRADRANLALLLLAAPIIAVLLLPIFRHDIFAVSTVRGGSFVTAIVLLFVIALASFFLGAITAAREIAKEAAIYRRERLVDLSPLAYVASKVTVLLFFSLIQSVLLVAVLALAVRFPSPQAETIPLVMAAAFLTSLAGMAIGLFISALVRNENQAMTAVPLILIPMIIYAGVAIPLAKLPGLASVVSEFMVTKWAVELLGNITDMTQRVSAQTAGGVASVLQIQTAETDTGFETAFEVETVWRWLVLAGFFVGFTLFTLALQWRKGRA